MTDSKELFVQVYGVLLGGDNVEFLMPDSEANSYAIAIGRPGDFVWLADVGDKTGALKFAREIARVTGAQVLDHTYEER